MNKVKKKPELLLHICCAACGAFVSQSLLDKFSLTLFYYNPNIFSEAENEKRLSEVKRIAEIYKLPLIIKSYDHVKWLDNIKGLESQPEKGDRCYMCYQIRMRALITEASKNGFTYFSTTLSVSPYKVYKYIKEIGENLAKEYSLNFYDQDFKKNDGFKKSGLLSKELNIYRQNYCGCEFSFRW